MIDQLSKLFDVVQARETDDVFEVDIGPVAVGFDTGGSALPNIDFLRSGCVFVFVDIHIGQYSAVVGHFFQHTDVHPRGARIQHHLLFKMFFQFFFQRKYDPA